MLPYDWINVHVCFLFRFDFWQLIQLLRKSGNIEKLRAAREEMNKYFPLTPKMWQEWVKDEISLSSGFVILFPRSDLVKYLCYRH